MNSRQKGARGERQWRDELRANGYMARRGQQFSGSPDSPDVVCDELSWLHFEVKAVERLNIEDAMEQARRDSQRTEDRGPRTERRVPVVAHRRSFRRWLVTIEAETFFQFLRGTLPPQGGTTEYTEHTEGFEQKETKGTKGEGTDAEALPHRAQRAQKGTDVDSRVGEFQI